MAENAYFKTIKKEEPTGAFGGGRRIAHSFTDYFRSMDRTTIGFKEKAPGQKLAVSPGSLANAGSKALGAGGTALGTVGLGAGMAVLIVAATASSAFVIAVSGPIAAVVGGVLGLIVLAKSAYSNRTAAHKHLTTYGWTLIDDAEPKNFVSRQELYQASSAALVLLEDGKSQISRMGFKLQEAGDKLLALNQQLKTNEDAIKAKATAATGRAFTPQELDQIKALKDTNLKIIERGLKENGAIWEYTRRIVHVGNYIQAASIISLAMRDKIKPSAFLAQKLKDPFAGTDLGTKSRELFTNLAALYNGIVNAPSDPAARAGAAGANMGLFKPGTV